MKRYTMVRTKAGYMTNRLIAESQDKILLMLGEFFMIKIFYSFLLNYYMAKIGLPQSLGNSIMMWYLYNYLKISSINMLHCGI